MYTGLHFADYGLGKAGIGTNLDSFGDVIRNSPISGARAVAESMIYYDDGVITNRQGKIVSREATTGVMIARLLGFYPTVATKHNDIVRMSKRTNAYIKTVKGEYTSAYVKAKIKGDRKGAIEVLNMVKEWNKVNKGTIWEFKNFTRSANRSLKEAKFPTLTRYTRTTPLSTRPYTEQLALALGLSTD